jgi:RHS repeat-associated protein
MKTWTFQVGTTPAQETAVLTWNPLGSLRELSITDGFNSGGTEDCKFGDSSNAGYDDLDRLMRVDCGSGGWGQSYSYDPYGYDDLTKTILSGHTGITFNPTYNTSNNQYASSFGTTYDSNGNVLYDASSTNTYAWNEFGKMKSVNIVGTNCATSGTCVIYDALGRAVEFDSGSQKTEIFYTQSGKAYLNGSTFLRAYWPAPGNGTVLQADAGAFYWEHKDWLGSARISSTIANETIIDDRAYAPFGEVYAEFGSTSQIETIFTGDTQDWVSGMYNTPNRELVANQGRWMSPDPAGAGWNAYAYVTDPNTETDPSGLGQGKGPDPGCSASIRAYCPWQSIFGGMIDLSTLSMQVRVKTGSSLIGVSSDGTVTVGGCGDLSGCQNQEVDTYTDSTIYPFANLTGLFGSGNASKSPAPAANNGKPVPCQDQACELARALRQTGVGTLNSPCTIGGFYLGSAALGAGGAAVANAPEIVAVASENYPTWFNRFVSWLAGKASNPGPVGATGAALGAAYAAGKQFCGSF